VLAAAFAVLMPAAATSAWTRGTLLSTSGYVAAVTPVAANPAVRAAVQEVVTSEVDVVMNRAGALPGPLGSELAGLAGNGAGEFTASSAFRQLWVTVNTVAHSQLVRVLNGDSTVVTATGGEVVLNLLPLVNDVLHGISGRLSALTGNTVALPPVTALPAAACRAFDRQQASSGCGQIPLFPASALARPRLVFRVLGTGTVVLLILPPLAFAGALWTAPQRRRTLLQMAVGGALALLAAVIVMSVAQSALTARAAPRYQAVVSALAHAATNSFFTLTTWCLVGCSVLAAPCCPHLPPVRRYDRRGRARPRRPPSS
jgi:hypothetical protein